MTASPAPGSPDAIKAGCICHPPQKGKTYGVIVLGCPIHARPVDLGDERLAFIATSEQSS